MEPSESDIDSICQITGLDIFGDRGLVARALKAKNLNSEAVLNEFFDDENKFRSTYHWDDGAFSADREGTTDTNIPSFTIHSEDQGVIHGVTPGNWYEQNTGAPSRPPSRVNTRSPLGRMVDLTADRASGPSSREQEDADLQRAIAESVAVSGRQTPLPPPPPPQESGVTNSDATKPYFGPANRNDYEQNQWAMVTIAKEKQEPGPLGRKREPGVPAFLRCRRTDWGKHRLGSLLTIFHEIPAARNALLRLGMPSENYGYDSEWWKGKAVPPPQYQMAGGGGGQAGASEEMWIGDSPRTDFSEETHRLMAFLDGTDRAYGTADVLADLRLGGWASNELEQEFMDALKELSAGTDKIQALMAQATIVPVVASDDDEAWKTESASPHDWNFLKSEVAKELWPSIQTLYNLWDNIFLMEFNAYNMEAPEQSRMAIITKLPEVITISVSADGLPSPFEVPEIFYVDRYLPEHRVEMVKLQMDMYAARQALDRAKGMEQHLTQWVPPGGGAAVDRRSLARTMIERDRKRLWQLQAAALWRTHEELRGTEGETNYIPEGGPEGTTSAPVVELTPEEETLKRHYEAHIHLHETKLENIDAKLKRLSAEKEACEQLLRTLQRRRTVPSEEDGWRPVHRYTLRGVTASPEVMYVCRRAEPDLMEMDGAASSPTDEWWKLGFVTDDDDPIKAERTTFEKAVEESCGLGSTPILVYATDRALEEPLDPLSDALKTFVKFDNRIFRQEVTQDVPRGDQQKKRGPSRGSGTSPSSPSKRPNRRSSSLDSLATNHASLGDLSDGVGGGSSSMMMMRDPSFEAYGDADAAADPVDVNGRDPFLMGVSGGEGEGAMEVEMRELVDTSVPVPAPFPVLVPTTLEQDRQNMHRWLGRPPRERQEQQQQTLTPPGSDDLDVESPTVGRQDLRLADAKLDGVDGVDGPADGHNGVLHGANVGVNVATVGSETGTAAGAAGAVATQASASENRPFTPDEGNANVHGHGNGNGSGQPEMQTRSGSLPFVAMAINGKVPAAAAGSQVSAMDLDMEG